MFSLARALFRELDSATFSLGEDQKLMQQRIQQRGVIARIRRELLHDALNLAKQRVAALIGAHVPADGRGSDHIQQAPGRMGVAAEKILIPLRNLAQGFLQQSNLAFQRRREISILSNVLKQKPNQILRFLHVGGRRRGLGLGPATGVVVSQ